MAIELDATQVDEDGKKKRAAKEPRKPKAPREVLEPVPPGSPPWATYASIAYGIGEAERMIEAAKHCLSIAKRLAQRDCEPPPGYEAPLPMQAVETEALPVEAPLKRPDEDPATPPPAVSAETPSAPPASVAPGQEWRTIELANIGLPPGVLTVLTDSDAELLTVGDLEDYLAAGKLLLSIPGVGKGKVTMIESARERFWRDAERKGWQRPAKVAPSGPPVVPGHPITPPAVPAVETTTTGAPPPEPPVEVVAVGADAWDV